AYRNYRQIPVYQASARVVIQPQRENYGFREAAAADQSDYQTQYAVLRSRSLIKKTMQTLGIWQDNSGRGTPTPTAARPPEPRGVGAVILVARKAAADLLGTAPPPSPVDPAASD